MKSKDDLAQQNLNLRRAYSDVADDPKGSVVLEDIVFRLCGFKSQTLLQADPQATGHAVGRRDVATAILEMIHGEITSVTEGNSINVRRTNPSE